MDLVRWWTNSFGQMRGGPRLTESRFRSHGSTPIRFCCNCPPPVHGSWPRTPERRPFSRLRLMLTMPDRRHGYRWRVREMLISLSTDISSPLQFLPQLRGSSFPSCRARPLRQVKARAKHNQPPAPMRLRLQPKPPQLLRQVKSLTKRNQRSATKTVRLQAKTTTALFEPAVLFAYDISHWIKKGPNVIVAAVRTDMFRRALFANGFLVRDDGSTARFETSSAWRIGDQSAGNQSAQSQRPVEFGKDGSAPWGYLRQDLARPVDHSDFATLAKSCMVISFDGHRHHRCLALGIRNCGCSTAGTTRPRHGSRRPISWARSRRVWFY